jgi:hypothetical protein
MSDVGSQRLHGLFETKFDKGGHKRMSAKAGGELG